MLSDKQEQAKLQSSWLKEVTKIVAEINEMETKIAIQRINETKLVH
jgi:hypothetical protein